MPSPAAPAPVPTLPTVPTVGERKLWRLRVLKGAPFTACTLAGHTFHLFTEPVIKDPRDPNGYRREHVEGIIEPLLEETVADIRSAMRVTYVRWENREYKIAHIFRPTERVKMDPSTDEPVARFLSMTPAERLPGTEEVSTSEVPASE